MNEPINPPIDRRTSIKWLLTAVAAAAVLKRDALAAESPAEISLAKGYGVDPDLLKNYEPGMVWPLTFNDQQRRAAAALCDVIIPVDGKSPAASEVGVTEFIDEWISAPYPGHAADRKKIVNGLVWLDAESQRRFSMPFANLVNRDKRAICDEICYLPKASAELKTAAVFFQRYRDLTAGGFYTTPVGMKDIGYIGNTPQATFEGPPEALVKKLGL